MRKMLARRAGRGQRLMGVGFPPAGGRSGRLARFAREESGVNAPAAELVR